MKSKLICHLITMSLCGIGGAAPFQNGSFEAPPDQSLFYLSLPAGSTILPGWVARGPKIIYRLRQNTTEFPVSTPDGSFFIGFNVDNQPPGDLIEQTFDTIPGNLYRVTFRAARFGVGSGYAGILAQATSGTNAVLGSLSVDLPAQGGFGTPRVFSFVAATSTSTLKFHDISTATNGVDALLDAVSVEAPLFIFAHPQSQVGYWGKSVSFSITAANGTPPYTYQWLKNGVEIEGATGSLLELTNLQAENAGSYTVAVKDADNTTLISQAAHLTVNPAGVSIATYAGLTIDGVIGQTYGIQATTDLSNTSGWFGVANVTLAQPIQIWYDSQSTAQQPKRFYRVVAGPISIP